MDALPLRLALVLRTTEDTATVIEDEPAEVAYAEVFPRPRTERVSPGHLVALAALPDGTDVVVWRWYDAVVLGVADGQVRLWEPGHGEIAAEPREPERAYRPGSRAYLSAGLVGAGWWVAGPAVDRAETAQVELDEVGRFLTEHDLWDRLS